MGLLELPDVKTHIGRYRYHCCVLVGIMGYLAEPYLVLIHEIARRSERVDNAALSSAVSYEIPGQMMERAPFCTFSR